MTFWINKEFCVFVSILSEKTLSPSCHGIMFCFAQISDYYLETHQTAPPLPQASRRLPPIPGSEAERELAGELPPTMVAMPAMPEHELSTDSRGSSGSTKSRQWVPDCWTYTIFPDISLVYLSQDWNGDWAATMTIACEYVSVEPHLERQAQSCVVRNSIIIQCYICVYTCLNLVMSLWWVSERWFNQR